MKKQPLRHEIQTYPAGRKVKKGGIYDDVGESPEKRASKQSASAEMEMSKLAPRHKGAREPARSVRTLRSTTRSSVPGEGHASAILNQRVTTIGTPEAQAQTRSGQGQSSDKLAVISPAAENQGMSGRLANQGSKRAAGRSRKRVVSQANNDEVKGDAASEQAAARGDEPTSNQDERHETSDQDSSFQESSSRTDSDDEDEQQVLDLFGQENDWKKIFEAARSVCGKKIRENRMPKLQTETIGTLMISIKEARTLYETLAHYKKMDQEPPDRTWENLECSVDAIEEQIKHDDISEAAAYTKRSEMIRDIYACAIPALVYLLSSCFTFYGLHPHGLHRFEALREIVRVQEIIILLCVKAKSWKAKPNTDDPIIKPTRSVISPYIRHMNEIFKSELAQKRRNWKMKQNALKTAKCEEEGIELSQRQREESTSNKGHRRGRIFEDVQRQREILRSSRNQIVKPALQSTQKSDHHRSHAMWTKEEEKELITQLKVGYKSGQTPEYRYLAILNARPLQNKLPEHVREQALALKPFMLEVYGALNPPVSLEWIESIV
ncbi:hypothetical protein N7G274_002564 [Stereocaulon virgatum]|uniref:Uncharacterized protein n=1 Tax=Stereocaulon virgatum TaxID=373712 RepID=A0ABR4AG49_9LECA